MTHNTYSVHPVYAYEDTGFFKLADCQAKAAFCIKRIAMEMRVYAVCSIRVSVLQWLVQARCHWYRKNIQIKTLLAGKIRSDPLVLT